MQVGHASSDWECSLSSYKYVDWASISKRAPLLPRDEERKYLTYVYAYAY